jgi:protein gp37
MAQKSNIQWTDATWNIARGCTKVDEDCKFCYMYRDSFDSTRYNPLQVVKTKTVFNLPLKIKEPSKIFTCSLTDFFHEDCDTFRNEAWDIIRKCPQHQFQILTKRPERILENLPEYWQEIKDRCWLGTSIGSDKGIKRALDLIKLRKVAGILFLSIEPMHTEVNFRWSYVPEFENRRLEEIEGVMKRVTSQHELLMNIDWVIVGGESGNETGKYRYRPCKIEWIEQMVQHCKEAKVAVFVKQFGTHLAKELKMTDRHGGNIEEFPEHLRIREFPLNF